VGRLVRHRGVHVVVHRRLSIGLSGRDHRVAGDIRLHTLWHPPRSSVRDESELAVRELLITIGANPVYIAALWFLAVFPVVIAALAINSSRVFYLQRINRELEKFNPHLEHLRQAQKTWPLISIVIPACNEQDNLSHAISRAFELRWPSLEVIVIDDGSIDDTPAIAASFGQRPNVHVVHHASPQGKSRSLNEGMKLAASELVLIMDADAEPDFNVLERMASHFVLEQDLAAVTGNPRAIDVPNLLTQLQAIEFSSTVSTLRRGQSAWGRINTVSGIMTLLRRDLVLEVGGFSAEQPTEDIELTWRLQLRGYRCIYEPAAQVGMIVPRNLRQWFAQRKRWSQGLVRVLQAHAWTVVRKNEWPLYPLLLEATLAIIWCHLLILFTALWAVALIFGAGLLGNSLVIGRWGAMTVGIAILQILWGMKLDSRHDKGVRNLWPIAPLYPLAYWWMQAFTVVWTTVPTLLTPRGKAIIWNIPRSQNVNDERRS
jgi:poly-beta-1,6-N-acetyl-D-glucosamine synthase